MTSPPTPLGHVLQEARKAAGLKQYQLAQCLGLSTWSVNRLENGHLNFQTAWLEKLPPKIRLPVIEFLKAKHQEQMHDLDRLARVHPATARRIARPTEARRQ